MPLALVADTIDSIPEALRSEYTERDGKFHLNVEGLEDTTGLKSALKKERDAAAANLKLANGLKEKVAKWEALGKTDEEIAAMLTDAETAKLEAAKKAGNYDALLADVRKKADEALNAAKAAATTKQTELETELGLARASERTAIIESSLATALTKVKATAEGLDLLTERLGKRINFETVDGKRVISITQVDGKTPMAGKGADGTATFDDLVQEAVKTYPSLFEGTGAGGGGTPTKAGVAGSKEVPRADWDKLGPYDQAAKIKAGFRPVD